MKDSMGDRMKTYEKLYQSKVMRGLPVIVRLDGKSFSKFTKRFERPFDNNLRDMMVKVTQELCKETNALLGYTQSDEITLVLNTDNPKGQLYFNAEVNKLNSVLASTASGVFTKEMVKFDQNFLLEDTIVRFDCRTFGVPNKEEATNAVLWRYKDCLKNSVTQVAQEHFSHKDLNGVDRSNRIALTETVGDPWYEYPVRHKEGVFLRKSEGYLEKDNEVRFEALSFQDKIEFIFQPEKPLLLTRGKLREIFAK